MRGVIAFFSRLIAKFDLPKPALVDNDIERANDLVQIGDVILCKNKWSLGSLFIPGPWTHAALVVDYFDGDFWVLEATTKGVKLTSLDDLLMKKDSYKIKRSIVPVNKSILRGIYAGYIGRPYDFSFLIGNRSIYCSELIVEVFSNIRHNVEFTLTDQFVFGPVFLPSDFTNNNEWIEVQ